MEYIIKKTYSHDGQCFVYQAWRKPRMFGVGSMAPFNFPWLSPKFKTPEEVIDYMEKDQIEEFIDPKTIKRAENDILGLSRPMNGKDGKKTIKQIGPLETAYNAK